jgi:hypothetical protein
MLVAMQHVTTKPEGKDTTYEQREYRKWIKADRRGFMTKKADLERAALLRSSREDKDGHGKSVNTHCL